MTTEQTPNYDDFFGQATSNAERDAVKFFTIKEGETAQYRIAPSVKSLRESGRWWVASKLHFGYGFTDENNKFRSRPFKCIEKKNYMGQIEVRCPECDALAAGQQEIEALVKAKLQEGKSEMEAEAFVAGLRESLKSRNLDKKYYVLAKNTGGEWGILGLRWKALEDLEANIKTFQAQNPGQHPLDARSGLWVTFSRNGKGRNTVYKATFVTEVVPGGAFRYKVDTLTRADAMAIDKLPDLATVNDRLALTADQIRSLVASGGDPLICAQVFGAPRRQQMEPATVQVPQAYPQPQGAVTVQAFNTQGYTQPYQPQPVMMPMVPVSTATQVPGAQGPTMAAPVGQPVYQPAPQMPVQAPQMPVQVPAVQGPSTSAATPAQPLTPGMPPLSGMDPQTFLRTFGGK